MSRALLISVAAILLLSTPESVGAVQSDPSDDDPTPNTQTPDESVSSDERPESPAPAEPPTDGVGFIDLLFPAFGVGAVALIVWRRWYRLDTDIRPNPTIPAIPTIPTNWIAHAAILLGGYFVLGMLGSLIALGWMGLELTTRVSDLPFGQKVTLQVGAYSGQMLVVGAALFMGHTNRLGGQLSRLGAAGATRLAAGAIIIAFPIVTLANFMGALLHRAISGQSPELIAHSTLQQLVEHRGEPATIIMLGLAVVIAPIVEEVIYRGVIQRTISGLGVRPWPSIAATSVVFALMHGGAVAWHVMPGLFVLSLAFGWAYHKTGRLMAPILMHIAFNSINVALALIV